MPRKPRTVPTLTGPQVNELLRLLHRYEPAASRAIVRGLHINRSTLSRWRRHRGVVRVEGLAAPILARLHRRVVEASPAERKSFEKTLDWALGHDDQFAVLSALLWIAGAPAAAE